MFDPCASGDDPRQVCDPEQILGGTMKTALGTQASTYLLGRLRRKEIKPDSMRMPRIALRELCTSFGDRPVNQLGDAAIQRWLEGNTHKSPGTRRNELGAVRGFCQWLVREGKLRRDPTVGVTRIRQPRKVVHTVNRPEIQALWQACENPRDRALVSLMFVLGLRCVDASNLNVDDWDRFGDVIIVCGKGDNERTLPVVPQVAAALREWIACDPRTTGALFPSSSGRLKPATISGRISELLYRAGVKQHGYDGKSAHALRRTAATETLDSSKDLRAVQEMLGHADMSSLKHYIRRTEVAAIAAAVGTRFEAA